MSKLLIGIAKKIGVDKAIAYSSGGRVISGITGVASVFFITTFLSGVEQGFYYTFGSILALQVFFELGLTGIMTQYVAHEASHLTLDVESGQYVGEFRFRSRLSSLIHFCVKWYGIAAMLVFVFLSIVGYFFFSRYGEEHSGVNWLMPWLLVCAGTAIKLFQSPFNSTLMGLGMVKEMSKIIFWQNIILPAATWTGLVIGLKLYVVGIGYLFSVLLWQLYVWRTGLQKIIFNLWKNEIVERVSYLKEIFPYQWKIALSWISGYFITQLYNPVLFATEGAIVAGQMGITLNALNAIQALVISWISTKVPLYSKLIALKNFVELDIIFNKTVKQMALVCLSLLLLFILTIYLLDISQFHIGNTVLASRFLPITAVSILCFNVFLRQFTNAWATYLRCHKQEPFLILSIAGAVADTICIFTFGKLFGLYGIIISYMILGICFFPWGYWIYKTKKAEWHK